MGGRLALAVLVALTSGCGAVEELFGGPSDAVIPTSRPDPRYEELFSHYVELCAVSQIRPIDQPPGGIAGHAVLYLKGACKDEAAGYPRLRPCRGEATSADDPEHGAGVSVNKWFKNVNWVATPGRRLFFDGDLDDDQTLDRAHFDRAVQRALDLGVLDGVEMHLKPGQSQPEPMAKFAAEESIGTDFALRFGRSLFCTRLPMTDAMLNRELEYLNALNDEYHRGEATYDWKGYGDNCAYLAWNGLAAAGVWKPRSVRQLKIRQVFNIAVPANVFVDAARLFSEYPVEDFGAIHRDELRWQGLLENDWLPALPGALIETLGVHEKNELYDTQFRLLVAEVFERGPSERAAKLLRDERFLDLETNLRFFRKRYAAILAARGDDEGWMSRLRGDGYREARRRYYEYIEGALGGTDEDLARLGVKAGNRRRPPGSS